MPEFPAMIEQSIIDFKFAFLVFAVTGIFFVFRDEFIAVLIIVNLCRFKFYFIHAYLFGNALNIIYLVFIGFYDKVLEYDMGQLAFEFFLPGYDIFSAFKNLINPSA